MRRKTTRLDQPALNRAGCSTPHPFQCLAVKKLIDLGWRVSSVNYKGSVAVVVLRMVSDSKIGTAVYPNGSFCRSKTPTIKWDWKRAVDASTATIPDPYVADILGKVA